MRILCDVFLVVENNETMPDHRAVESNSDNRKYNATKPNELLVRQAAGVQGYSCTLPSRRLSALALYSGSPHILLDNDTATQVGQLRYLLGFSIKPRGMDVIVEDDQLF